MSASAEPESGPFEILRGRENCIGFRERAEVAGGIDHCIGDFRQTSWFPEELLPLAASHGTDRESLPGAGLPFSLNGLGQREIVDHEQTRNLPGQRTAIWFGSGRGRLVGLTTAHHGHREDGTQE